MTSNDRKTKTVYLIRHAESEENRRLASLKLILTSLLVPWRGSWPSYQDVTSSLELLRIEAQLDSDLSPHGFKQVYFFVLIVFIDKLLIVTNSKTPG
jgi:broad specificity phosphatase PhoE